MEPIEKLQILLERHIEMIGGIPEKQQQLYDIIQDVIRNVSVIATEGQKSGRMRSDIPPENIAVAFLGMIQPAGVIWHISDGEFDLKRHRQNAWKLFSDVVRVGCQPTIGNMWGVS